MTDTKLPETAQNSLSGDLFNAARYYLGNRTGFIAIAAVAIGLGAYSNWGWLVAAGIAPLLLTALPCAAMCAIGLCSMGGKSKRQNDEVAPAPGSEVESGAKSSLRLAAAPGEDQDDTPASSQRGQAKPRNRKDCG